MDIFHGFEDGRLKDIDGVGGVRCGFDVWVLPAWGEGWALFSNLGWDSSNRNLLIPRKLLASFAIFLPSFILQPEAGYTRLVELSMHVKIVSLEASECRCKAVISDS